MSEDGDAPPDGAPGSVLLAGHDVPLGRFATVRRLLPQRARRLVGAWCFVDHFGPDDLGERRGMQVPPHPHTGLQTVTWLVEGEILHRDSLGSEQAIRPGQLNLMTSGHGIAHSEQSPADLRGGLHGLQLWLALPVDARHVPPRFEHHADLPTRHRDGVTTTVVVGELDGLRSPAIVHTPLLGAELVVDGPGRVDLALDPAWEHAVVALTGTADVGGTQLTPGSLVYLATGRSALTLTTDGPGRLFVLGGEPYEEPLVMWWNFVGGSHEEVAQAREDWAAGRRFGTVAGCLHEALPAPPMPTVRLRASDRHGHRVG